MTSKKILAPLSLTLFLGFLNQLSFAIRPPLRAYSSGAERNHSYRDLFYQISHSRQCCSREDHLIVTLDAWQAEVTSAPEGGHHNDRPDNPLSCVEFGPT